MEPPPKLLIIRKDGKLRSVIPDNISNSGIVHSVTGGKVKTLVQLFVCFAYNNSNSSIVVTDCNAEAKPHYRHLAMYNISEVCKSIRNDQIFYEYILFTVLSPHCQVSTFFFYLT